MNKEFLANSIIYNVGGRKNINSLTHCITRLRFELKDKSQVKIEALEALEGVMAVVDSGGQIQVVIGSEVNDVYAAVVKKAKLDDESNESTESSGGHKKPLDAFIDLVSGIFQPIIRVLAAAGIMKGIMVILLFTGVMTKQMGTYKILWGIADTVFYYLPVIVAVSAAKKFKLNPYLGLTIGATLLYPSIASLTSGEALYSVLVGTPFESKVFTTFMGLPVILMNYKSSVIPALFAVFFASRVDRGIRKVLHKNIREVFAPVITLCVSVPVTFLIIGPIATFASDAISAFLGAVYNLAPPIAGIIMGGTWQLLVMMGLHWGVIPLFINEVVTTGSSGISALQTTTPLATTGVVLAIYLKTKDLNLKSIAAPAMVSSFCGVSEPAIYGITLPRKKPFIITLISAAVGGFTIGMFRTRIYVPGGMGIFKIPTAINPEVGPDMTWYGYIIAMAVAFTVGFILTWFFGFDDATDPILNKSPKEKKDKKSFVTVPSPMKGGVVNIETIDDAAFAKGVIGKGIAIDPTEGKVYSPVDGELSVLFPTGHAIGLKSDQGLEILIHVGMDTVKLEGEGFKAHVKQGDRVSKGDLLVEFDMALIKERGFSTVSPVVITNSDDCLDVIGTSSATVEVGEDLMEVVTEKASEMVKANLATSTN